VKLSDLHKLDLLDNIYRRLFKHMMQWVEEFLKNQEPQQAFEDHGKEILTYPGFCVPKKAY